MDGTAPDRQTPTAPEWVEPGKGCLCTIMVPCATPGCTQIAFEVEGPPYEFPAGIDYLCPVCRFMS